MSLDNLISIEEAAAKHRIDARKIRGALWQDSLTGRLELPIGSLETDEVYDDDRLRQWAEASR